MIDRVDDEAFVIHSFVIGAKNEGDFSLPASCEVERYDGTDAAPTDD